MACAGGKGDEFTSKREVRAGEVEGSGEMFLLAGGLLVGVVEEGVG